ncbi:EAL domain-containing protein [Rhizobium sp. SGZ-381]|uniref:bifunctional diguanylate cyclase/phosphodiesterase n=1 Tax=Rhizobium sp. SGZ-381 TaxID=3342800 RepID=UPI003671C217
MRWRLPVAVAGALALSVIATTILLDRQHRHDYQEFLRGATERTMIILRQRLASRLQGDLILASHLGQLLGDPSAFDLAQFAPAAHDILLRNPHLVAVALAPDNKLGPIITAQAQAPDAGPRAAVDRGALSQAILAHRLPGPALLSQGAGDGMMVLVLPVSANNTPWGKLALVIDHHRFLAEAGIEPQTSTIALHESPHESLLDITIRHVGSDANRLLTGPETIVDREPDVSTLPISGGHWELSAAPPEGWSAAPNDQPSFRLLLAAAGLGMILPILAAGVLIGERNRHIAMLKAREAKLVALSQRFSLAMETSSMGIWEVTDDNNLTWDARAAALYGYPEQPGGNRLEDWVASIHPDDVGTAEAHFFGCICSTRSRVDDYRICLGDGTIRTLRSTGATFVDPDGSCHTTGIVWDVTADAETTQALRAAKESSEIKNAELELALDELSHRERELEELSTKLDLALASYDCGIWETYPQEGLEVWDRRMCQLYGIAYTDGRLSTQQWLGLIHPQDRPRAERLMKGADDSNKTSLVVRVPQADGSIRFVRTIGRRHGDRDGAYKFLGIALDVTEDMQLTAALQAAKQDAEAKNIELQLAQRRIEHNALHDPLTMLANRRKLDVALDALSRESQTERRHASLLHLDLDRFKQINDTLGHAAGDAMLVHAAQILTRNVRNEDVVARIGGDEFVILVANTADPAEMAALAARIVSELHQPIEFEGFSCRCGVSIGIAQESGRRIDARKMLINADIALYRAKHLGRNRFEFFTQNLQAEVINNKRMADEILVGIEQGQFATFYQPQFCARTYQLVGGEALVRWRHPDRGLLTPDVFLKIAEDLNVAATLDQLVLETVLRDQMLWAAAGIDVPRVSVNVSAKRLHDRTLADTLNTLSISPGKIAFELVESIFLDESDDVVTDNLNRIKALGIDIEVDDFGTGHTSIVSLLKLKPKRLKIDRQLVMPILSSQQERGLVRSIIEIARSLGIETVAEGVETIEHAALLKELGCDLLQGFAFSQPLAGAEFAVAARRGFITAA